MTQYKKKSNQSSNGENKLFTTFSAEEFFQLPSSDKKNHCCNNRTKCHKYERLCGVLKLKHSKQVFDVLSPTERQETLTEKGQKPNNSGEGGHYSYRDVYWNHPKNCSRAAEVFSKADLTRKENSQG